MAINALSELVANAIGEIFGNIFGKACEVIGRRLLHVFGIRDPSDSTHKITTLAVIIGVTIYLS